MTAEEKADLEYFFRFFMFENYGAYVLFGSKPLCEMHLRDEELTGAENAYKKWIDSLPKDKRAEIEAVLNKTCNTESTGTGLKRNPYRGWLALEKIRKKMKIKNFIFRLVPVHFPNSDELIPGSYELVLINIQRTTLVLAENYEIFKNAVGMDFDPSRVVFEAKNPNSLFWKNVFFMKNHLAKGLLFGFGLRNSLFFHQLLSCSHGQPTLEANGFIEDLSKHPQNHHFALSTTPVEFQKGSLSNFTIPVFRTIPGEETVEKYTKEKAAIERTYHGQDIVEVTLRFLLQT